MNTFISGDECKASTNCLLVQEDVVNIKLISALVIENDGVTIPVLEIEHGLDPKNPGDLKKFVLVDNYSNIKCI